MFNRRQFVNTAAATSALTPALVTNARAQAWPDHDIHSICMFPAGSGADVIIRYFSNKLQEDLHKPVVVENKPGAFGTIATAYVARQKPDGYTIYITAGSSVLAAAASLFKTLPFDPVNDFDHITTIFKVSFLLVVKGDSPYKTVADLTKVLKEKGDKASYGSVANTGLVASELYKASEGLKTVEVKYKENQAMFVDLLGGQIEFAHIDYISAQAQLQDGSIRAIANSGVDRVGALPNVPGSAEAGIKNCDVVAWWSVHTPKGTPQPILDKLETIFNGYAKDPEVAKWLINLGCDPFPGNHNTVRELLVKDIKNWADYVKLANIPPLG